RTTASSPATGPQGSQSSPTAAAPTSPHETPTNDPQTRPAPPEAHAPATGPTPVRTPHTRPTRPATNSNQTPAQTPPTATANPSRTPRTTPRSNLIRRRHFLTRPSQLFNLRHNRLKPQRQRRQVPTRLTRINRLRQQRPEMPQLPQTVIRRRQLKQRHHCTSNAKSGLARERPCAPRGCPCPLRGSHPPPREMIFGERKLRAIGIY